MTISKETIEEMKLATKADKPTETRPWNIQDHLKTNEQRTEYLRAALEENDKSFIATALCDIAESLNIKNTEMYVAMIMNETDRKILQTILKNQKRKDGK